MALILPKGVFVNSPEVNGSIERIDAEPLDLADIAKFWKGTSLLFNVASERLSNAHVLQYIQPPRGDCWIRPQSAWRTTGGASGAAGVDS